VDGVEEPSFPKPQELSRPNPRALDWENFVGIPPVLVVRARPT
jgi:hypothetical protein